MKGKKTGGVGFSAFIAAVVDVILRRRRGRGNRPVWRGSRARVYIGGLAGDWGIL